MSLALIFALQAAAAPAPPPVVVPLDFDLARYRAAGTGPTDRACRADDPAPIVVCARRPGGGDYPLDAWARLFATHPLRAEHALEGGAVLDVHAETVEMPQGLISNRAMIRLRMPF